MAKSLKVVTKTYVKKKKNREKGSDKKACKKKKMWATQDLDPGYCKNLYNLRFTL